ncbi:MAG: glycosyltransferase family 39 protein [Clostridia bacterium]|nr:glycosyltransferase family 39 protein [Clostridia bacterium]
MKNTIGNVINAIIKKEKLIAVIVLVVMTAAGLAVTDGYGVPLDEELELNILSSNVREYALHVPGRLGAKLQNATAGIEPISESDEKDHGISAYYAYVPIQLVLGKTQYKTLAFHMYTFVIFIMGVLALYGIVHMYTDSVWMSLFGALMLYLSPRMFGEGHYNNKDMVAMAFVLITMYFGIRMIREKKYRYAVAFALAAAIATNTKIIGAWFYGIIGPVYLVILIVTGELKKRNIGVGLAAIAAYVIFYVILTPAMWSDPAGFIEYIVKYANNFERWDNRLLFEGTVYRYSVNPPPAYYLPKMILITTPLYVLILTGIGAVMTVYNAAKSRFKDRMAAASALNLILWVFPIVFAVVGRTRIYNGWRHFYFVYGPMIITASYGAWQLFMNSKRVVSYSCRVCAVAAVVITALGIVANNPHEFAYFNILAGSDVEERYEMDYWLVSTKEALMRLYEQQYDGSDNIRIAAVGTLGYNSIWKVTSTLPQNIAEVFVPGSEEESAQYYFYNPYSLLLDEKAKLYIADREKAVVIRAYGREISCFYKVY